MDELLSLLQRESESLAKRRRVMQGLLLGFLALFIGAVITSWIVHKQFPEEMLSILTCTFSVGAAVAATGTHRRALKRAIRESDPRLTGYLLEATSLPDSDMPKLAREWLKSTLPLIDSPVQLTPKQRDYLYKSLFGRADKAYLSVTLEAIRRIGDRAAIPYLEALVDRKPSPRHRSAIDHLSDLAQTVLGDVRMRSARTIIEEKTTTAIAAQSEVVENLPLHS